MKEFSDYVYKNNIPQMDLPTFYNVMEEIVQYSKPQDYEDIFRAPQDQWNIQAELVKYEREQTELK